MAIPPTTSMYEQKHQEWLDAQVLKTTPSRSVIEEEHKLHKWMKEKDSTKVKIWNLFTSAGISGKTAAILCAVTGTPIIPSAMAAIVMGLLSQGFVPDNKSGRLIGRAIVNGMIIVAALRVLGMKQGNNVNNALSATSFFLVGTSAALSYYSSKKKQS